MRLRDAAALALSTLRASAVKTLLTILGLAVGVAAVLTVRSLGAAGEMEVEREIGRMGVNKVWITAEDGALLDVDSARTAEAAAGASACAGAATAGLVSLNGESAAVQIAGYGPGMLEVHGGAVARGRSFSRQDHAGAQAVCIVDGTLVDALGGDVLGQRVDVAGRRLMVIGVVRGMPMPSMAMGSGMLLMPLSTWEDTFGSGAQELTLTVPLGRRAADVSCLALAALGEGFSAETLENEIDAARQIVRIFVMVLACVAAVCVLTGGIGVMNVLLVSVRERRREIGLLKALGATSVQVGLIFLLEAAAYALLGGLLGTVLGAVLIRLFGGWVGLTAQLTLGETVLTLLAAALMGMGFGVTPAIRAAGLEVVDALRSE